MDKEGIREHKSLGVEKRSIEFCPWGEPAQMEKGFSFEISKEKQKKLKAIFLKGSSTENNRGEMKTSASNNN